MTSTSMQTASQSGEKLKLNWSVVSFFIAFHLLALLAPWCFSWSALGVALVLHWLTGSIGICLGYHRLLSHRGFQVPKWLEYIITTIGAISIQGGPIFWVSSHRMHHAHTEDDEKDPYSSRRGFWWSHLLWMIYRRPHLFDPKEYRSCAPDLAKDAYYTWLDSYFIVLQIPVALILYAMGGWSFVIYGVFLRIVLLWHATWFINSMTHLRGTRRFDVEDNSRNLWWAAILAYGEGWHNNHHANPRVAKAGWRWWEIDMTWWVIKLLMILGLAKKVIMPPVAEANS